MVVNLKWLQPTRGATALCTPWRMKENKGNKATKRTDEIHGYLHVREHVRAISSRAKEGPGYTFEVRY